jgi:hypothetical protein
MKFSNLNELSILELIGYTPACLRSTFLCIRHGFGLNKGCIFHLVFSLIRIIGASLKLAAIHSPNISGTTHVRQPPVEHRFITTSTYRHW